MVLLWVYEDSALGGIPGNHRTYFGYEALPEEFGPCFRCLILQPIQAKGRGAKATQQGLLGTISGWALLGLLGQTWLLLSGL